ncbi:universal stress protein [Phyllobacterium sp. SYP-B3895]|uniref:universal stress protein n=1 Tax=Phyllobacterium sp. SYP-B3895 TaxID=2663240 RepID=UPI0012996B73|nr:universal stress protein [Phyllobacterium sp. SYP-B3895]MRG57249.1 universal stress protein [Phyllobacterium sp. SYP-B3895]
MAFRTIIAFIRSEREAKRVIDAARLIASSSERTHIIGLYTIPSPIVYADPTGFADTTLFEAHEQRHKENSEAITKLFNAEMGRGKISHEFRIVRSESSSPSAGVTQSALRADIIIAGQPDPNDPDSVNDVTDPLVMESGRPVLFVPYKVSIPERIDHVVLAFNGKREASRAAFDALPLLLKAHSVDILWIDPKKPVDPSLEIPGTPLSDALRRHGVNVTPHIVDSHGEATDKVLRRRIAETNASLFVMGAYSQSRLKEWVFGGVTSSIMADMPCLTLMSR